MRQPTIDWYNNDFLTRIDGMEFRIITSYDGSSDYPYIAIAYITSFSSGDKWYNEIASRKSIEHAILKLVNKIENEIR